MPYAQIDHTQKLGTSEYTIADSGSLLTAIANLLKRYGGKHSPAELDAALLNSGVDTANGITWGYVSCFKPTLAVSRSGKGVPSVQANESIIVELQYSNQFTKGLEVVYALVEDIEAGTIVDSYDGTVKKWDIYGGPTGFVGFTEYPLVSLDKVITLAEPVQAAESEAVAVVLNKRNEAIDLTDDSIDLSGGIYEETPIRTNPQPLWQQSFKRTLNTVDTVSLKSVIIRDIAGRDDDKLLDSDVYVPVAGIFERDGVRYFRTTVSVEQNKWYGIPIAEKIVKRISDIVDDEQEIDDYINSLRDDEPEKVSRRDKVIRTVATGEGKFKRLFNRGK